MNHLVKKNEVGVEIEKYYYQNGIDIAKGENKITICCSNMNHLEISVKKNEVGVEIEKYI
ncbi:25963_t:CDS:1, partial [Racocetra persica]